MQILFSILAIKKKNKPRYISLFKCFSDSYFNTCPTSQLKMIRTLIIKIEKNFK